MSIENSDQNGPIKVSRADDLLLEYIDELLSSPASPADKHVNKARHQWNKDGRPIPTVESQVLNMQAPDKVYEQSASSLSKKDSVVCDDLHGSDNVSSSPTSNYRHPNLRPASAILASKKTKPFKDSTDKVDVVVAGLMPKLKPAAKPPVPEPDVSQGIETKEEVVVSVCTPEVVQASEVKLEPEISVDERAEFSEPEVLEKLNPEVDQQQEIELDQKAAQPEPEVIEPELSQHQGEVLSENYEEPPSIVPPPSVSGFRELAEFEMLLFEVRGLQLAVPLISLGSIHRLEEDFTPIVGRADWYLGMYRIGDRNLQVVDTARWVMPSRMQVAADLPYEFVIRLADTNWALACTSVEQAIRVERDEIKWRTQQGKRPWLAGTVISKMCALLDVESMARLLNENKLQDTQ